MAQIGEAEKVFNKLKLIVEQFQKDNPNATDIQIREHITEIVALDTDLGDTMNHLHIAVDNIGAARTKARKRTAAVRLGNRMKRKG